MHNLSNEKKKDWLDALLIDNFGNCKKHKEKFNEKNVFCLDCGISLCRHGKDSHSLHRRFQIYKYCYQDVVRYSDLLKYFDCSNIQTYISNNDKIVHLKPRPSKEKKQVIIRSKFASQNHDESQMKETNITTPQKPAGTCEECGKHLQDKRNQFCSIKCKITGEEEIGINQNSEVESSISIAEPYEYVERVNLRKRPRKTTPMRSISSFVF